MTTIITRVFPDPEAARRAAYRLSLKGISERSCRVIVAGETAAKDMARAMVHESAIASYGKKVAAGNAVLVVQVTYKPLGAARIVRDYLDTLETVNTGKAIKEHKIAWEPERAASVMKDHPHFLSYRGQETWGGLSSMLGIPTLKKPQRQDNLMPHDRRLSRMFWPMKLVSGKNRSSSVIQGGSHMSKVFWPMPLILSGERRNSVIRGGGFPFSRRIGIKTIS